MVALAVVDNLNVLEYGNIGFCPSAINSSKLHMSLLTMFVVTLRYNIREDYSFPDNTEIEAEKLHDYYMGRA